MHEIRDCGVQSPRRKEQLKSEKVTETQIAIIGAGIIGSAIDREFSKYKVDV